MESRSSLSTILIVCGTMLVVAALVLVGYQMSLSAADVRDHRTQSSSLLRDSTIERVTLSQWEPPTLVIAWAALVGGFGLVVTGIRKASPGRSSAKPSRHDEFD
jgi:hypothetical protein